MNAGRSGVAVAALLVGMLGFPTSLHGGKLVLVAGGGSGGEGSSATELRLIEPFGFEIDPQGNFWIVELSGGRVWKIDAKTKRSQLVNGATKEKGFAGDNGPAVAGRFNGMHNLAIAPNGDVYLADTWNHRVRKIDAKTGQLSTIAGTGEKGYSGDGGPATQAKLSGVYCVALAPKGDRLYIADLNNKRVRLIRLDTGIITTVAGNGKKGVPEDGAIATDAPLVDPRAVAVDSQDNLYILERDGNALRVVDRAGKIRTVVGTGQAGYKGDNGPGRLATLKGPKHLCIDRQDNVVIADAENHVIRKYLPREDKIVRVAGTGKRGNGGLGGPADQAELARPHGVFVDRDNALWIVDSYNDRIVRIEPDEN